MLSSTLFTTLLAVTATLVAADDYGYGDSYGSGSGDMSTTTLTSTITQTVTVTTCHATKTDCPFGTKPVEAPVAVPTPSGSGPHYPMGNCTDGLPGTGNAAASGTGAIFLNSTKAAEVPTFSPTPIVQFSPTPIDVPATTTGPARVSVNAAPRAAGGDRAALALALAGFVAAGLAVLA